MADQSSNALPRLADALLDVGTRLHQISDELRVLRVATAAAPGIAAQDKPAESGVSAAVTPPAESAGATAPEPATHSQAPQPEAATLGETPQPRAAAHGETPRQAGHGEAPRPPAAETARPQTPPPGAAPQPGQAQRAASAQHPQQGPPRPSQMWPGGPRQPAPHQGVPYSTAPQVPWYPPPKLTPEPPVPTLWERLSRDGAGSRILAWAGAVVTLAGVVLLLILAIQRGYIGPELRVLLGAAFGLVLAGIGGWLHRSPTARTGAYALAATGIAVLYLDVVATTSLYEFLPPWGGLVAGLAVTAGGVALAGRWDSQLLAVFVMVCCAVSAPILTMGFDALLLAFLLVLLLGATPVQLVKGWGGLALAAGLPAVITSMINIGLAADHRFDGNATLVAIMAGVTSGVVILLATITAARRPADNFVLVTLVIAPLPGLLAAVLLPRVGASILPAAIGALLVAVWAFGRTGRISSSFALSAGGIGALALLQATATAFDGDARAIAFLAEALITTVLAVRLRLPAALAPSALFGVIGLALALGFSANPGMLARPPRRVMEVSTAVALGLTGLVLATLAITFCWAVFHLGVLPKGEQSPPGWLFAGVLALYGATATILSVGLLISPDRAGFLLGHVLVTVSWTVGALVLLLRGIDSVALRVAGLSLVVAALAKLVLFDLSSLDGMARVLAFLVAGIVLLAAGARYAKLVATRAQP
jgi:uncharacterized membrane protein